MYNLQYIFYVSGSETFWSQNSFMLLKITEESKDLLFTIRSIFTFEIKTKESLKRLFKNNI